MGRCSYRDGAIINHGKIGCSSAADGDSGCPSKVSAGDGDASATYSRTGHGRNIINGGSGCNSVIFKCADAGGGSRSGIAALIFAADGCCIAYSCIAPRGYRNGA